MVRRAVCKARKELGSPKEEVTIVANDRKLGAILFGRSPTLDGTLACGVPEGSDDEGWWLVARVGDSFAVAEDDPSLAA